MRPKEYDPQMVQRVQTDTSFRRNREDELREMLGLAGQEGDEDSGGSDGEMDAKRQASSVSEAAVWQTKLTDQLNAKNEAQREVARLKKEMQLMQEKQKEELSNIRQMSRSQLQIMRSHIQKKDERIQALKHEYNDTSDESDSASMMMKTPRVLSTPRTARPGGADVNDSGVVRTGDLLCR